MRPVVVDANAWKDDIRNSLQRFEQVGDEFRMQK